MTFNELNQPFFILNGYKKVWLLIPANTAGTGIPTSKTATELGMTETEVGNRVSKKNSPEDGEVNIDGFAKLICKLVGSGGPRVDRVVLGKL